MKTIHLPSLKLTALLSAAVCTLTNPAPALAHCHGLDGPVVKAAQKALAEANINLVLIWVQKDDEIEIHRAFEKALAVRKLGNEARELADRYFFETLVRVHRAGEGARYTGLKPAGRDLGPAIPAGDKALETGDVAPVRTLLSKELEHGLHQRFEEVMAKKRSATNDVTAGRAFMHAYVNYIHYVEGLHEAAAGTGREDLSDAHESSPPQHKHAEKH